MFQVGKKVICIKDHSVGEVTKGQVFPLEGIRKGCCSACPVELNIGLEMDCFFVECRDCGHRDCDENIWLCSSLFAPYDDSLSEMTADELIESLEIELVPNF